MGIRIQNSVFYIKKILPAALLAFINISFSGLGIAEPKDSPEDLLTTFMPKACVFSGEFSQTKNNENFTLSSKGLLFYHCDYGLIWQSNEPFLETTVYKEQKEYFLVSEDGDIEELTSQAQKGIAGFLLRLMSGDKDYFLDSFSIMQDENNLVLTPNSRFMKKAVENILLSANHRNSAPEDLQMLTTITMTNGNSTAVTIEKLKEHPLKNDSDPLSACRDLFIDSGQAVICKLLKRKKTHGFKR